MLPEASMGQGSRPAAGKLGRWAGLLGLGSLLACGTAGTGGDGGSPLRDYGIEIFNRGSEVIHEAQVSFGSYRSRPTGPGPGRSTGESLIEEPVPEVAVLQWRDAGGTAYRREVEVLKHMPEGFAGNIVFEIGDGDQVQVQFRAWPDPGF